MVNHCELNEPDRLAVSFQGELISCASLGDAYALADANIAMNYGDEYAIDELRELAQVLRRFGQLDASRHLHDLAASTPTRALDRTESTFGAEADGVTTVQESCQICRSTGVCPACRGAGWIASPDDPATRLPCATCFGGGRCPKCGGKVAEKPAAASPSAKFCDGDAAPEGRSDA